VPTGNLGTTLVAELNRLANGGTYPPISEYLDEAAAARAWAAYREVTIYHTDTVGVLNDIAGIADGSNSRLDYTGICNYLAGTTGLTANAALQSIDEGDDD
jgi:hypothetical protein